MNFNKFLGGGNLTRDIELRYLPDGTAVCTLSLAINDKRKDKPDEVLFIDVDAFGKTAENCSQYLSKGSPVFIDGKLRLQQWEKDGQKRSKISVTAHSVQFLSSGKKGEGEEPF